MTLQVTSIEEASTPWRGGVLIATLALWPPVAWGGNLGHAPLAALAGLLLLADWRRARPTLVLMLLGGLLAWAVSSSLWSAAPTGGFSLQSYDALEQRTWLKLLLQGLVYLPVVLAATALSEDWTGRVAAVLAWAVVALSGLVLFEGATGARLYLAFREAIGEPYRADLGIRNVSLALYPLVVLAWPAIAALSAQGRARVLLAPVACLVVAPLMFDATSALAAFAASATAFFMVRAAPRNAPRLLGYGAAAVFVLAPLVVDGAKAAGIFDALAPHLGPSWAERLRIWTFAAEQVARSPFVGQGLDASRLYPDAIPLHTHDAALQIWLELGAVGAALAAVFWVAVFQAAARIGGEDRTASATACAAATAYFVAGALSFGVWQEWWLAIGALGAAAVVVVARFRAAAGLAETTFIEPLEAP